MVNSIRQFVRGRLCRTCLVSASNILELKEFVTKHPGNGRLEASENVVDGKIVLHSWFIPMATS